MKNLNNLNNSNKDNNEIKVHYSLLPAFFSDDPVKDAILEGVKVTGITFYYNQPFKIIAQYPVFIPQDAHYESLKLYLKQLADYLLPMISEKINNNEQFNIQELISDNKQKSCCSECHCDNNYFLN